MLSGMITDIQRTSIHDGSGIRTTVFLKGCPLSCKWCHNPECIDPTPQILYYPEKCINCGKCDEGCFSGARVVCGREMSSEDILHEVKSDAVYYGNGGEPLYQADFLKETIGLCKENGINCAVETSLIYYDEDIFRSLDFVMADLKIWNSVLHEKYTGVGNEKIIENFKRLDRLNIPIIARTPVIPEIKQEIDKISAFLKTLDNVEKYELLPYHPLGNTKRKALGLPADGFTVPAKKYMKELLKYAYIL